MFTSSFLVKMRRKALRRRVWYRALDRVERGILSLTAHVIDRVKSVVLGVELVKILKKLRDALKSGFVRRMEEFGLRRARALTAQAVAWGSTAAKVWDSDYGFVRYVTLLDVNAPSGWGF